MLHAHDGSADERVFHRCGGIGVQIVQGEAERAGLLARGLGQIGLDAVVHALILSCQADSDESTFMIVLHGTREWQGKPRCQAFFLSRCRKSNCSNTTWRLERSWLRPQPT